MPHETFDHAAYHSHMERQHHFRADVTFSDIGSAFATAEGLGKYGFSRLNAAVNSAVPGSSTVRAKQHNANCAKTWIEHRNYEPLVSKIRRNLVYSNPELADKYFAAPFKISCDCRFDSTGRTTFYHVRDPLEYTYEEDVEVHSAFLAAQAGWTGEYAALASGRAFGDALLTEDRDIPSSWSWRRCPQARRRPERRNHLFVGHSICCGTNDIAVETDRDESPQLDHLELPRLTLAAGGAPSVPDAGHTSCVAEVDIVGPTASGIAAGDITVIAGTPSEKVRQNIRHCLVILQQVPVCWTLIVLGTIFVCGSLSISLYFSLAKDEMSDGFTAGSYVLAVGAFVLGGPVAKHYAHCKCWKASTGNDNAT